ncbi:MAG: hypothetical protein V7700_11415, partial [Halioglobus sp.]
MKALVVILLAVVLSGCRAEYVDAPFWKMHTIEDQLEGADGVDLFDIDGDGDLDTVSGWEEAGDVLVHENPGAALVRKPWTRTSVSGGLPVPKIEDARFADFDDDGQLDAVVSATENRSEQVGIHWLLRRDNPYKKESWHGRAIAPQLQYLFVKVAIGQIDGRGALDLAVGSKSDNKPAQLVWYQAPADPGPETTDDWRGRAIADINWTDSLEIVDINGDGANDILLGYWQHLAWYENPGHPDGDSAVWKPHLISDTTKSYFARCDAANAPASALRIIVGADISAAVPGATVAWLVSKELDANNVWNGRWLQQRITSPDPIPRDPEQHEYWVKS